MQMKAIGAVIVWGAAILVLGALESGAGELLENGYLRVRCTGSRITSLEMDAAGRGRYGPSWVTDMGFEGFVETPQTLVVRGDTRLDFRGLQAEVPEELEVKQSGLPELLTAGHTLGQSFEVKRGLVTRLEICVPTWYTSESAATLTLRRGGPRGARIAQRRLEQVRDNSWQELSFVPQGPGVYYVEMSEPTGMIGWWSSDKRKYGQGRGYADGQPIANRERSLRVHGRRAVAKAEVQIELDGRRLKMAASTRPLEGESGRSGTLVMTGPWDNTGYDISAQSVPFSRFFTDNMRYMAVQQLKRWKERGGRYELNFSGCNWIEADGTGSCDLRFGGRGLSLAWQLGDKETTLRWGSAPQAEAGALTNQVSIEVRPREDTLPKDWPRFRLPDRAEGEDANLFFYERAFSWAPVWGPAAWHEWNALGRCWHGGRHLDAIRKTLQEYPISEEGYVHTWGAKAGWPFPDNSKYDTRHFDTNARFILACRRYAAWTGDLEFLRGQAERLRRAMKYQLNTLHGQEGLIVTASKDVTGRHQAVGDNYWDILPFGHLDAYANVVWYASLEAMAQIEELLAQGGGAETVAAARGPEFYRRLAREARRAYNRTFWDEAAGRYIGCVDLDGKRHDYGFTFVNLEAMAYGLSDAQQVRRIYDWMERQPTSTGKADTYTAWIFAPRATTVHDPRWDPDRGKLDDVPQEPWWHFGWHGTAFGDQCQDGGAILYTSFFDLMARCRYLGPDNAWRRWQEIVARWRLPDHLCGGPPLYRGEHPQEILPGAVGVDVPFPESSLVPCWLLYGLLGVEATSKGLEVAPRLPVQLPWVEVQNVAYRGLPLTLRGSAEEVVISCEAPGYQFRWRRALGSEGRVVFTQPPAPVQFPERPLWERSAG